MKLILNLLFCFLLLGGKSFQEKRNEDLSQAVLKSSEVSLDQAIKMGANPNTLINPGRSVLMEASFKGKYLIVKKLVSAGANINFKGAAGQTALHQAINSPQRNYRLINYLLKNGAKVNARTKSGTLPLFTAIISGDSKLASMLIQAGARKDDSGPDGKSLKKHAVETGNKELAKLFKN